MKTFQLHPEGTFHTIQELEQRLRFKYLPLNAFESPEEQQLVREKGLAKLHNNEISKEAQELGARYSSEIAAGYIPPVSIAWVNEHVGYGLLAAEDIAAGSYCGAYTGIVRKNERRYFQPPNDYCYEYPVPDEIGRSYVIDATSGHLTRFINHSADPNLKPVHVFHDGYYHLIFIALCDIKKGIQLSYNYGNNYWVIRDPPTPLFSPQTASDL